MILFGHKVVFGFGRLTLDGTPVMRRYGVYRERIGPKGGMTVIGLWPLLVAVSGRMPNGQRWTRTRAEKQEAWDAMMDLTDDYFAFEAACRREPYFCGSNYCDDPACEQEHAETL